MSGTSTDGVDAVLARFEGSPGGIELLAHRHTPFDAELRQHLLSLNTPGPDELHRSVLAANQISAIYAKAVQTLLEASGQARGSIVAIGAHGQTVRHRPGEFDGVGYTVQLLNGARLAELTGIDVVCDFRSRDVAAGGQGAPLVPAFHRALFGHPGKTLAVLNLGGIANLTLLDGSGDVAGFDCGPGNVLLDLWAHRHLGVDYDVDGAWAAGGTVDPVLLTHLLTEPYFRKPPPKSTGRDLFNADWLQARLNQAFPDGTPSPRDVQSTLAELTAHTATAALRSHLPSAQHLLICGGGAFNTDLCHRIAERLPQVRVQSTSSAGVPPMQVEAAAFAWLAHRFDQRMPGNCRQVTGARGDRILGCLYPA